VTRFFYPFIILMWISGAGGCGQNNSELQQVVAERDQLKTELLIAAKTVEALAKEKNDLARENKELKERVLRYRAQLQNRENETALTEGRTGNIPLPAGGHYDVQPGDSLWSIARKHWVTVEEIKKINNLGDTQLRPGQKLKIPPQ
jgi:LysM repeat protein